MNTDTDKPHPLEFHIPGPYNLAKWGLVLGAWALLVLWFAVIFWQSNTQWSYVPDPNRHDLSDLNRPDQCEQLHATQTSPGTWSGTVLEPENTWSNAAYLLAGLLILAATKLPLGYLTGLQLVVLALLSGYYHCTLQGNAQTLDVAGIYVVLWALALYGMQSILYPEFSRIQPQFGLWRFLLNRWTVGIVLALFTSWAGYEMAVHRTDYYLFGSTTVAFTMVTAIIVLASFQFGRHRFHLLKSIRFWLLWTDSSSEGWDYLKFWRMFYWTRQSTMWNLSGYFLGFAVIGGISLVCRFSDGDGNPLCSPHSVVQAHAIWHVFGAYTLLLAYDWFAWSAVMDYPVFGRIWPSQQDARRISSGVVYATSFLSIALGLGLFALTFVPKAFVDNARAGDTAVAPHRVGTFIAAFYILVGALLLILHATRVIPERDERAAEARG